MLTYPKSPVVFAIAHITDASFPLFRDYRAYWLQMAQIIPPACLFSEPLVQRGEKLIYIRGACLELPYTQHSRLLIKINRYIGSRGFSIYAELWLQPRPEYTVI